ncbi:hypothetical protein SAMN05443637_102215 [Pseudonocardia thermophila]|uniref:Uncharacterized protein n=1 Tax=Pseudonocardia thermophila TaxID=1848 RepID=A0A1M6PED3_PSETH|nr:hypothetical protein [Pseudonocardia thermophila]SHK06242.1 hypothetical protein SAMN05443637_102215 [Pseudonocardia thermophila]
MTISDLLTVIGATAGVAVLVVMAAVPLLLALPLPGDRRAAGETAAADRSPALHLLIPAQRTAAEGVAPRPVA